MLAAGKRDKISVKRNKMALAKSKKRNLKERRSFHGSDEVRKAVSENEDHLEFVKEDKPEKADHEKRACEMTTKKKGRREKGSKVDVENVDQLLSKGESESNGLKSGEEAGNDCARKSHQSKQQSNIDSCAGLRNANRRKRIKHKNDKKDKKSKRQLGCVLIEESEEDTSRTGAEKVGEIVGVDEDCSKGITIGAKTGNGYTRKSSQSKEQCEIDSPPGLRDANIMKRMKHKKGEKGKKSKRKDTRVPPEVREECTGNTGVAGAEKVDEIMGVDEDCSRGMKKWLIEYKQSRPSLKILQERIDEFIVAHETQQEQASKEREALAAEGGWTVVVHHKGRKKTTDSESGTAVGSVAQAAVLDKMAKKKSKELHGFYRFQLKEARRNEVMMLQSKFEQDKKRIQQLRAARKFRPY